MDFKREITDTAKYIIIGLTLAFVINLTLGYAFGTEKPVMAVVSNSMVPTFYRGDLIVVRGVDPKDIEEGDIIVFHSPYRNRDIVHRVVRIEEVDGERYFYTKGDNNNCVDQECHISPPVDKESLKGKLMFSIPKLGWFKIIVMEKSKRVLSLRQYSQIILQEGNNGKISGSRDAFI